MSTEGARRKPKLSGQRTEIYVSHKWKCALYIYVLYENLRDEVLIFYVYTNGRRSC